MLTLYWAKDTGAMAPQILLEELDLDYDRVILDITANDQNTAEYLAINPMGQVPALKLEDDTIITESSAIMMHLADQNIEADLIPFPGTPERAQIYRWMAFAVANIYDADRRIYHTEFYTTDPAGIDAIREQARIDMDKAWGIIETNIIGGPYFLGDRYTILDPYLFMLAYWYEQPDTLFDRCPKLDKLCKTVFERPVIESIWHQNFPED